MKVVIRYREQERTYLTPSAALLEEVFAMIPTPTSMLVKLHPLKCITHSIRERNTLRLYTSSELHTTVLLSQTCHDTFVMLFGLVPEPAGAVLTLFLGADRGWE